MLFTIRGERQFFLNLYNQFCIFLLVVWLIFLKKRLWAIFQLSWWHLKFPSIISVNRFHPWLGYLKIPFMLYVYSQIAVSSIYLMICMSHRFPFLSRCQFLPMVRGITSICRFIFKTLYVIDCISTYCVLTYRYCNV